MYNIQNTFHVWQPWLISVAIGINLIKQTNRVDFYLNTKEQGNVLKHLKPLRIWIYWSQNLWMP